MKMSYTEQLRHPNWQRKRLEALSAANFECESCGDKETTLNVHHKRYVKGRMAWEYDLSQLVVLCEPCHQEEHAEQELLRDIIDDIGLGGLQQIIGLICGYSDANASIDPGLAYAGYEGRELYYELGMVATAAESLGMEGWRQIVRDVVASRKVSPPAMRGRVEMWNEEASGKT